MDPQLIQRQSEQAYNQWCEQWRVQAKYHSKHEMKLLEDFQNVGVGRAIVCLGNGFSFEEEIETIKKHQGNVDILVCDKTLGACLDHGISPTYVMVCDANVNYEKYMEPWKDQLQDTILFSNVCANPKWTDNGNWKDTYFFVNMDILKSEKEFMGLSGCENVIPAATNVSNAMVVLLTQSANEGRRNFFGYDKILLVGYDYSWQEGKYYAFDSNGGGKDNYMRHVYLFDRGGNYVFTSNNLAFSARWLDKYIKSFNLPVVVCSKRTILSSVPSKDLESQMTYSFRTDDKKRVRYLNELKLKLGHELRKIETELKQTGLRHWQEYRATT